MLKKTRGWSTTTEMESLGTEGTQCLKCTRQAAAEPGDSGTGEAKGSVNSVITVTIF